MRPPPLKNESLICSSTEMFKILIWGGSDQKTLYSPVITYMIIMQAGLKVNHFCIILIAILHFLQNFSHARETFMHCVLKKEKSKRGDGGKKNPGAGRKISISG